MFCHYFVAAPPNSIIVNFEPGEWRGGEWGMGVGAWGLGAGRGGATAASIGRNHISACDRVATCFGMFKGLRHTATLCPRAVCSM